MKGKWFQTFDSERRALRQNSYTGISASQRDNDFEVPDLERGYTYFFPSWKFKLLAAIKRNIIKLEKQTVVLRVVGLGKVIVA